MALTWEDRASFLDPAARRRVNERFLSCAPAVEKAFRLPSGSIGRSQKLGCGYYGCAYLLKGQPRARAVVKVTSDPLEANAVENLLKLKKRQKGGKMPAGLLRLHAVRELGKCALKGRDVRTLWAIWREELDDSWPEVKKLGVRYKDYDERLETLVSYLEARAGQSVGFLAPDRDEVKELLEPIKGLELLRACEWLIAHGMFALDVVKPDNIGWREGTGLVIRDIGATEAERDVRKDIPRVGGASGRSGRAGRARRQSNAGWLPLAVVLPLVPPL